MLIRTCILNAGLYRCARSSCILGHVENADGNGGFTAGDAVGIVASFSRRQREEYKWSDDESIADADGCGSKSFNSHALRHRLLALCVFRRQFAVERHCIASHIFTRFQCSALPAVDPRTRFYERSAKEQIMYFRRRGIIAWEKVLIKPRCLSVQVAALYLIINRNNNIRRRTLLFLLRAFSKNHIRISQYQSAYGITHPTWRRISYGVLRASIYHGRLESVEESVLNS